MEKVPHKKRRRFKKSFPLLMLLLAVALCLGGLSLLRSSAAPEPQAAEKIYLLNRPKKEIASLAIISKEYGTYPLARGEDEEMKLPGREDHPLRQDVVEDFLNAAAQMESTEVVYESREGLDLKDFGLTEPALRLVVTYSDGEKKEVRVGNTVTDEENTLYYCTVSGDDRLFVMLQSQCDIFFHDEAYLLDFRQPKLDASLLDGIEVSGDMALSLSYTPVGWLMEAPFVYPAEPQKTEALLSRIEGMAFEAYLGDEKETDLEQYGLDQPALTVTLRQAPTVIFGETEDGEQVSFDWPAVEYHLLLGDETGKSGVYVLWNGGVYRASNFLLGFWKEIEIESLLCRKPIHFLVNQLTGLTLDSENGKRQFNLEMVESLDPSGQIETDEYGQTLYDAQITENGQRLDASAFLSWYTELAALSPAGRLPEGYQPQGEAALTLTLETESQVRVLSFIPYDALHDALFVNGVSLFYVDRAFREKALSGP